MIILDKFDTNCTSISVGKFTVYFSYQKPIAFRGEDGQLNVVENEFNDEITGHIWKITAAGTKGRVIKDTKLFGYLLEKTFNRSIIKMARDIVINKLSKKTSIDQTEENRCQRLLKELGPQTTLPGLS